MHHVRFAARVTRPRTYLTGLTLAILALGIVSAGAAANTPTVVPGGPITNFKPVVAPLGLSNKPTTVVLQMAADPVAVVDAATPLSKADKAALKGQLKAQQKPIEQQVQALGGTVLNSYQSAYNGIKVEISSKKANDLAAIPGVVAVRQLQLQTPDNTHGVPLIGAPAAWDGLNGLHGEGIKVAVIDTGIDYTHADFGGSGNPLDYQSALASDTLPANPLWFGPTAPRVKGGIDLVGDAYNAAGSGAQLIPHPDLNPLDCGGHGSHTAGTAAGSGVLLNGSTYTGPYNASTIASNQWLVGPGVAPKADIYSIRVFGCAGSTNETVDAIEWAVDHDMDVINMSLGSVFGSKDDPSAVASTNAAKDGVIVVASAGNSGPNPYIVGSPSTGDGALSVAADDPTQGFPGANISLSTGTSSTAIDANGAPFASGTTLPVKVLRNANGTISLGCNPAEYTAAGVTGKLVVVARGTCARVARAIFGQEAGAAAVLMINNANSLPPYEGPITSNPDTGQQFTVTIPFFGVSLADSAKWSAADGGTATLNSANLSNPGFLSIASFSSGGARTGDSFLKPEVTAPGVSIASVGMGTGTGFAIMSGTSMAAPHTAGAAALVRQAHPDWNKVVYWKAALENTSDPNQVVGYNERVAGAGLIQVQNAAKTNVVALAGHKQPTLNFGFEELDKDFSKKQNVKLRNLGDTAATFNVSSGLSSGSPHSVSLGAAQVTVPAHGSTDVQVELDVPAATAGDGSSFKDVGGQIVFTPAGGGNNGVTLRVPYYLVPQAVSKIDAKIDVGQLKKNLTANATVTNDKKAPVTGAADWYAWGLTDKKDPGIGSNDLAAVGVQAFPGVIAFGIQTNHRWSNATMDEFDIYVDVNGDGTDDYDVVGADLGALTAGAFNGQAATAVFDLRTGSGSIQFLSDAPTDSSTIVLPVNISQLCVSGSPCLSATNPRFTYHAAAFGLTDETVDAIDGTASFNAFTPAISNGMFDVVAPGASATETVSINSAEWAQTPALGLMIVSHGNKSGKDEAQLVKVDVK